LSEAVVFGHRIARRIERLSPLGAVSTGIAAKEQRQSAYVNTAQQRVKLQKLMLRHVGLKRHEQGLLKAIKELEKMGRFFAYQYRDRESFEFLNLLTAALLTTRAALLREESRGAHYRSDFPDKDDLIWRKHIIQSMEEGVREESDLTNVE
jgi:L-aspartate oxidase